MATAKNYLDILNYDLLNKILENIRKSNKRVVNTRKSRR